MSLKTVSVASGGGGGNGTVTNVSITTANGVSGAVANSTTTPAITLTLGDITPTSVALNGDTYLIRKTTRNFQLGQADATTALAQTLSVQSVVAGTTDGAGQPFTLTGSQSTGTGVPGNILIQTASSAATTGFAQNALATVATFGPSTLRLAQTTPALDLAQTWNTSGTVTGLKLNVTNTASGTSSLLADFQVGGTSRFRVDRNGSIYARGLYGTGDLLYVRADDGVINIWSSGTIEWTASSAGATSDLIIKRRGAANFQFGAADAAAPVAQTLSVQSIVGGLSGTPNLSAAAYPLTITGAQGTGTGAGGSIVFQTAPTGGSGFAQNTLQTALTIASGRSGNTGTPAVFFGTSSNVWLQSNDVNTLNIGDMAALRGVGSEGIWLKGGLGIGSVYSSPDVYLYRVAAGIVKVAGTSGTGPGVVVTNSTVVGSLPAAATAGAGAFAFVTDATVSMTLGVGTAVVGGGANKVPVYSDGASWLIG